MTTWEEKIEEIRKHIAAANTAAKKQFSTTEYDLAMQELDVAIADLEQELATKH